jgi:hypothetical protein
MKLLCWNIISDKVFSVVVTQTKSVLDLKEAIKEMLGPEFVHLVADSLMIWKVSNSYSCP